MACSVLPILVFLLYSGDPCKLEFSVMQNSLIFRFSCSDDTKSSAVYSLTGTSVKQVKASCPGSLSIKISKFLLVQNLLTLKSKCSGCTENTSQYSASVSLLRIEQASVEIHDDLLVHLDLCHLVWNYHAGWFVSCQAPVLAWAAF